MWKLFKRKSTPEPRKVERSIHENNGAQSTVTIFEPKKIWFKKNRTIARSKDRRIQCTGIYLTEQKTGFNAVIIKIINSKRDISRQISISIPKEDIPEVVLELQHYYKSI